MEIKTISVEKTGIEIEGHEFQGYASRFNGVDSYGDTIRKGAFSEVIEKKQNPKMFFNHFAQDVPIGCWRELSEDDTGLKVVGTLARGHSVAENIRAALKTGALDGLSIGFRMSKEDYEETDAGREIKNISELVEISVVTFPADNGARVDINSVKSALEKVNEIKELERFLREAGGFSRSAAAAVLSKARNVLQREADDEAQVIEAVVKQLKNFKLGT